MSPGIYFDFPRADYDNIPALSCTVLKKWLECAGFPSRFKRWLEGRWTEAPTEPLLIGSALDCMMLTGKSFDQCFAVVPEDAPARPSKRTRNAKKPAAASLEAIEYWDKFLAAAEGKQILTAGQYGAALQMQQSLRDAECAAGIFNHCRKAVIVAELFGFPCKCEIDLFLEKSSTSTISNNAHDRPEAAFARASLELGYDCQATFYLLMAQAPASRNKSLISWPSTTRNRGRQPSIASFPTMTAKSAKSITRFFTPAGYASLGPPADWSPGSSTESSATPPTIARSIFRATPSPEPKRKPPPFYKRMKMQDTYSVEIQYNDRAGEPAVSIYVRRAAGIVTELHGADEKMLLKRAVDAIIADRSEPLPMV
jgi:hypothetical protein